MNTVTRRPAVDCPEAVADAVRRLTAARGYAPTVREIGIELRLDTAAALRAVHRAAAAGTIERRRGCPRAIRAVDHERGRRPS